MRKQVVQPFLNVLNRRRHVDQQIQWYQQDGGTLNTAGSILEPLEETFAQCHKLENKTHLAASLH